MSADSNSLEFSSDDVKIIPDEAKALVGHLVDVKIGTKRLAELWDESANSDGLMTHENTTKFFKSLADECGLLWDQEMQDDLLQKLIKDDPYPKGQFLAMFGKLEEDMVGGGAGGFDLTQSLRVEIADAQKQHS
eukprot:TRINITY_DN21771_c0_g1_i1.p1 TRINITY_DN21771_c0_g1~~TRINITY_DN21771_c0_g1_i1.p1  ORF type:complete len:144 (+),score=56.15 TRINITY_DN21771_c0_g1_i1:31-432(+)